MAIDYALRLFLRNQGYHLGRKVGEGYFREVYEVLLKKGALKKRFIAKIEKKEVPRDSVQHVINVNKGNLLENEIEMLGTLLHPNVVEIHDVLMKEKETIMIEEYFDAFSLEQLVQMRGKIQNNYYFKPIFSQVLDALSYLHIEREILHRDLKPSNILIAKRGDLVKLTDFQNAKRLEDLTYELFPTRGGTSFTHPELLNSLVTGEKNCASLKTEFYALGATMYFLLMGEIPFKYQVVAAEEGRKVSVGNDSFCLQLEDEGKRLPTVTSGYHEICLEERLGKVPLRYQKLLRYLMSMQNDSLGAKDFHHKVKEEFLDATYEPSPVVKPINFAHYDSLKTLAPNKEPLFLHEKNKLSDFIEEAVADTLRYGTRKIALPELKESGEGSDAVRSARYSERFTRTSPQRPTLIVEDTYYSYNYGTQSQGWRETFERVLNILVDDKIVLQAKRFLGGEAGNVLEEPTPLESMSWDISVCEGFQKAFDGMSLFSEREREVIQRIQEVSDTAVVERGKDLVEFFNYGEISLFYHAEQEGIMSNRKFKENEMGVGFRFNYDGLDIFASFVKFNPSLLEDASRILEGRGENYERARKNVESCKQALRPAVVVENQDAYLGGLAPKEGS